MVTASEHDHILWSKNHNLRDYLRWNHAEHMQKSMDGRMLKEDG